MSAPPSAITSSTAGAEFCSLCSAASQATGLKFLLQDLGETVEIKIGVDASVGKAMASRRGLGRAKHEQVQHLWVQSLVQEGSIVSTKIPGEEKRSDMMTKHLTAAKQNELRWGTCICTDNQA